MTLNSSQHFSNKRILVTGGAGFIGSHLVESLIDKGSKICVYDIVKENEASNLNIIKNQIDYISASVCDYEQLTKQISKFNPELIFHLAANASVPRSASEPLYDFEQNAKGTTVLLEAVRNFSPKTKIVIASSGAVYGDPGSKPICEDDPINPISPYGSSKCISEIQAQLYLRTFGLSISIARIFNCYGPRLPRFVVLDFLRKLKEDSSSLEILGDGKQTRDFTFVTDTVSGILSVASNGTLGQAYNIASGVSYTVLDLAKIILKLRGLNNTELKLTGSSWAGDAQFWKVSISKARQIGYEPQVNLEQGLQSVIKWYDEEIK